MPALPGQVDGTTAVGWEPVRAAFEEVFENGDELGAGLAVYQRDELVVDLWGGIADASSGAAWTQDTVALAFSTVKGMTALAVAVLVDRGILDLDERVASYWPEFAANGKGEVTLGQLLSHRIGVPAVARPLTIDDVVDPSVAIIPSLAAQRPEWEPGTTHGYHSLTFGWLAGEVVRRVTGRTVGTLFAEEVARPLGLDAWIGRPADVAGRCAVLAPPTAGQLERAGRRPSPMARHLADPTSLAFRTFANPVMGLDDWQRDEVISAEVPAATGVVSPRAVARMYAATMFDLGGGRLLADATVDELRRERSVGTDQVLGVPTRYGAGVTLGCAFAPMGGPECFGAPGSGGSVGFADPVTGLSFAYVPNRIGVSSPDERVELLLDAVYRVAGVSRRPVE